MTNMTTKNVTKNTKHPMGKWPFIVVGLLLLHVSGMVMAVVICNRHKPAVVENYYQKAVNWDKTHEGSGK